jgi:hypothetical protein
MTERTQEKSFTWRELQVFYSFWYFLMIITDLLVISGTGIKITILFKVNLNVDKATIYLIIFLS